MPFLNYILAALMGASLAVYLPMISRTSQIMGSPVMGNVPFFLVAFLTSTAVALAAGQRAPAFARMTDIPAWLFLAGVMSAGMILGASYLVPRIGPAALFVIFVAGQVTCGAVLSQFGLIGVPRQALSWTTALGIILVIAGAALVSLGARFRD